MGIRKNWLMNSIKRAKSNNGVLPPLPSLFPASLDLTRVRPCSKCCLEERNSRFTDSQARGRGHAVSIVRKCRPPCSVEPPWVSSLADEVQADFWLVKKRRPCQCIGSKGRTGREQVGSTGVEELHEVEMTA